VSAINHGHDLRLVLTSCPYIIVHTPSFQGFK
jgi:hypothetical protein